MMEFGGLVLAALLNVVPQPTEWHPDEVLSVEAAKLGEEGYAITFEEGRPTVVAGGERGAIWAKRTLEQLRDSGEGLPKTGTIIDKPKYRVRGFTLDVGRMYHPMSFLYRVAELMAYYKMNTFHVHLSDCEICKDPKADWTTKQAAFRMECETFPDLTAKDGHYTKAEFRQFMKDCRAMGITVIPEFDVPAHSLAFTRFRPEFASEEYGADHLDLNKIDEILPFLRELFAEYLTGDDPVFIGPYMHVGTDEYNRKEAEKFRLFTDRMFEMVQEFGYKPCAWGSLTHAQGKTPVRASKDITLDIWYNPYYQPEEALKAGYTVVSVPDGLVYLVPFAGYYYDFLNCRGLYENWDPRKIGNYTVPDEYMDQLAGGKFALWNDALGKKKDGSPYTPEDNLQRIFPAVQTLSQKFWTGAREDEKWEAFRAIADRLPGVIVGDEWQNNQKLSQGKEPTRAAFASFSTEEDALKILPEFSDRQISLDSEDDWKFRWSKDPASRPRDFFEPDFDVSEWETIKVPSSWQAYGANGQGGWGTALYTNIRYPFARDVPGGSKVMGVPPADFTAFAARNPVGSYRRDFEIESLDPAQEVFLKFDGVDSFFYLWVNGRYVGFSKDSRSPAEFNVTKFLKEGRNTVALEVYRYSDGSYLEDQDMFRLSGIFRHTWLITRPVKRIKDFFVTAKPVREGRFDGDWEVKVEVEGDVVIALFDWNDKLVRRTLGKTFTVSRPKLWSAEEPNCYKIVIGNGSEYVSSVFGFRVSEIRNGRYYLNGQPIKLKGANRHETDPMFGHFVPACRQEQDVRQLKAANCNCVRNAHYPQDDYWYYLCDVNGIYLVDEANVESHGYGYGEQSLSHRAEWTKATIDRNRSMVERNKNHPSVVIWSYGNEAGPGENFKAVEKWIKGRDTTRPTHYERDWSVADMEGCQYPAVAWVWNKAADKGAKKPFYISEYAHNMVNAMGNLKDYQDAIESSDVILGATIWDWVDQGLYMDKDGTRIIAFGGDHGDKPNDGQFVMNGCVLSDRTVEPGYYEIRHVYQNWSARANEDFTRVVIRNKNYFVGSKGVECRWELLGNGATCADGRFELQTIAPQHEVSLAMPIEVDALRKEKSVVSLRLGFVKDGVEIASDQIDFPVGEAEKLAVGGACDVAEDDKTITLETDALRVAFCKKTGLPYSIARKGLIGESELLRGCFKLNAFRTPSSNEVGLGGQWLEQGFNDFQSELKEISPVENGSFTTLVEWTGGKAERMEGFGGPEIRITETENLRRVSFLVASRWTVCEDGSIACVAKIRPQGPKMDLARIGFAFVLDQANARMKWFGRGPFENYADRKSGAFVGLWEDWAENFYFPYARNENCGNREETFGVSVGDLVFRTLGKPFAFEVNPYTSRELLEYVHPTELPESDKTHVGLYAATRGLGGASCGPGPMERDIIRTDRDYDLAFTLSIGDESLTPRTIGKVGLPALPERQFVGGAKVLTCSSREPGEGDPEHLIDGDLNTIWHSQYGVTMGNVPHAVAIELPKEETVRGIRVWGRRSGGVNGRVKDCFVETSTDGKTWTKRASATLANTEKAQEILFDAPVKIRYYRFTALNNHYGNDYASMAEMEVVK